MLDDKDRTLCGRFGVARMVAQDHASDATCGVCRSVTAAENTRSVQRVAIKRDLVAVRARVSGLRKTLARDLAGLSYDQAQRREAGIRAEMSNERSLMTALGRLKP